MLNRNRKYSNESKTELVKCLQKFKRCRTVFRFSIAHLFLTGILVFTLGCAKQVTFSSLPKEENTITVAGSLNTCEQVSKGRYILDECGSTNTQKCISQRYGKLTCYTRVNKTCEEGGMFSASKQCENTNSKKCTRTQFAGRTCYRLANKTCNDFDLYASKSLCDSNRSNIQKCESVRQSSVTCWKKEINRELFVSEQFLQPEYKRRKVDILFVNDNSISMREDQIKMSEKLNTFIGALANVDWHIGITTTDLSDGPYSSNGRLLNMSDASGPTDTRFITQNIPNKEELFRHTIQRPESVISEELLACYEATRSNRPRKCKDLDRPSGDEQPMGAIVNALNLKDSYNRGFFRDEADLAVVVLTDEDSVESDSSSVDVISTIRNIWGAEKKVSVYGVLIEEEDADCLYNQKFSASDGQFVVNYASKITELVNATNGLTGSICDADYGPTLRNIGRNIINVVQQFELANSPVHGTLSVHLSENSQGRRLSSSEYTLNNKTIQLHVRVTPSTRLAVSYIPH